MISLDKDDDAPRFEALPPSAEVQDYGLASWAQTALETCWLAWRNDPHAVEVSIGRVGPDGQRMLVGVLDGEFIIQHGDEPYKNLMTDDPEDGGDDE